MGDTTITSIADVTSAITSALASGTPTLTLLFAHLEARPNLTHNGIPIVLSAPFRMATHNQLSSRWEFTTIAEYLRNTPPWYTIVVSGDVKCVITCAMQLAHGKLLKQSDWVDWQESEYLQLNQYYNQGMLGKPHIPQVDNAIFFLVWTYNIKALDGQKKLAACVMDHHVQARCAFLTRCTQTALIKQACKYFMHL
jgi:hypothetical protein